MYCKNCGSTLHSNDAVCPFCGVPVGTGTNYCANCGGTTEGYAAACAHCGKPLGGPAQQGSYHAPNYGGAPGNQGGYRPGPTPPGPMPGPDAALLKSKLAAGLLGIFLGAFGIHNFYLGYTSKGVIQLLLGTLGVLLCGIGPVISGVWGFVEGILILCGSSITTDAQGRPLKE